MRLTREQQQSRTRAALIEAAGEVFIVEGFLGASVEAISSKAGYTRGAFYSNFSSKEELFAELLQERIYSIYAQMAKESADAEAPEQRLSLRQVGEQLAAVQEHPQGKWLFRLWLELLAHAGRDEQFREIAAGFWSANRGLIAAAIEAVYADAGKPTPYPSDHLATAMIALDIGLALQHFVDPETVPLSLYPELYEVAFGGHDPGG